MNRTTLRVIYIIGIGLYAVWIVVQAKRRELTGTKLTAALVALGCFLIVLILNVLRW